MEHVSVLLHESVDGLALKAGDTALDATLGLGGHTIELARIVGGTGTVLAFDVDEDAIAVAKTRLSGARATIHFICGNFSTMVAEAHARGVKEVNGILFDLGWNSSQLEAGKGLSFKKHEPLVMTLGSQSTDDITAQDIINTWSEDDLTDIIRTLGEERFAARVAKAIVGARNVQPIEMADELAEIIKQATPPFYQRGRIHPATKTFQALRIVVNDELSSLQKALQDGFTLLAPQGRMAVITFHSIEDGLVKRSFKALEKEGKATRITKKPMIPSREECQENPRARSAKLRIIEKL